MSGNGSESKREGVKPSKSKQERMKAIETERECMKLSETESKQEQVKVAESYRKCTTMRSGPGETKVDCQNGYAGRTQLVNQ